MLRNYLPLRFLLSVLTLALSTTLGAQSTGELNHEAYLKLLEKRHIGYAVAQYDVKIARTGLRAAKALPDPELTFSAFDNQQRRLQMGYGFEAELSWEIELGGKRRARQKLAQENVRLAELEVSDYLDQTKKEATVIYLQALKIKNQYEILTQHFQFIKRYTSPSLTTAQAQLLEFKLAEQDTTLAENRAAWLDILLEYNEPLTVGDEVPGFVPGGTLSAWAEQYQAQSALHENETGHRKFSAEEQKLIVLERQTALAKAERVMDLGVMVGVSNNAFVKNIIGPNPSHTAVSAGVSVPIRFSNGSETGTEVAELEQQKAQLQYQSARHKMLKKEKAAQLAVASADQLYRKSAQYAEDAKQKLEQSQQEYHEGKISLKDLLLVAQASQSAQLEVVEKLYAYSVAAENATSLGPYKDTER